ncbi:MAG: hypothetical protein U1G07_21575 [Verrucomicrobiota bacterium]
MKTEYLAQVASLVSAGFAPKEIGTLLGLSKHQVFSLATYAAAIGLLQGPYFSQEAYFRLWPNPQNRISLENLNIGLKLLKGLTDGQKKAGMQTLKQVKVIPSISDDTTSEGWGFRLCDFGRQALQEFYAVLSEARIIDIGWGGTVGAIVSAAEREGFPDKTFPLLTLLATCGELFDYLDFSNASSSLVERILVLIKKKQPAYTLRGVPALLDIPGLRDFYLRKHPGYRAIFGPGGLASKAEAAIVSVGTFEQKGVHAFKRALVAEWGATEAQLQRICWGDLGGVLVPRDIADQDGKKEMARISSLWTGVPLEYYHELAKRAAKPATKKTHAIPGVVVFAIGKNKAEILHEIINLGLVNRIVIDLDLAKALAIRTKIDLAKDIRTPHRADTNLLTVQQIITALNRLSDDQKTAVLEHFRDSK